LINLWLLKIMLRYVDDGVTNIEPEHQSTGNACVMWSDERSFTLYPTSRGVYVYTTKDAYNSECLVRFQLWNTGEVLWWIGQQYRRTVFWRYHYYPP
jgi:hypothetical protein